MRGLELVLIGAVLFAPAAGGQTAGGQAPAGTPPSVVYADAGAPLASLWRAWDGSSWTPGVAAASGPGTPVFHDLAVCSDWNRMALVRVDSDDAVRLLRWDGAAWEAPVTLTTGCGTHAGKVAAAAYEQRSRELLVVYREGGATTLSFRAYSGADAPAQSVSLGMASPARWVTMASRPGSDQILVVAAAGSSLHAVVWDGSAFGAPVTLESGLPSGGRAFDAVFTTQSGTGVVAWGTQAGSPRSRVWNGASWGPKVSLPAAGGEVRWLALAANPRGDRDEALMAVLDSDRDVSLNRFSGSAWGAFAEVETGAAAADQRRVDVAYQPDGARALAVWHRAGSNQLRYRAWNGVSWSSTNTGPDMGSESQRVVLGPGRGANEVLMGVRRRGAGALLDYLAYSQTGTLPGAGVTFDGPTGAQVPGVTLPAAPAGNPGSNDLVYNNSATVTLAPGAYGSLVATNNLTVNMSAGTYIFRDVHGENNLAFNLNTAAGDVRIIVTGGDLYAKNNADFINAGGGRATVHIRNGNLEMKNNGGVVDLDFYVYDGAIIVGNNLEASGVFYARGSIQIGSGSVRAPAYFTGGPGIVSAVVWTDGVPGAVATLATAVPGPAESEAVAIGRRPPFVPPRITMWREIDPATAP